MTTPIEVTRGEMYDLLRMIKHQTRHVPKTFEIFENSLEAHLEALRCELLSARQSNDDLRNKLQAFEFANKSAGELLIEAKTIIRRQREFIRTLYTSRKTRKSKKDTRIQSSRESASKTICGPLGKLCHHSWRDQFADLSGKMQKQCIFCLTIQEA